MLVFSVNNSTKPGLSGVSLTVLWVAVLWPDGSHKQGTQAAVSRTHLGWHRAQHLPHSPWFTIPVCARDRVWGWSSKCKTWGPYSRNRDVRTRGHGPLHTQTHTSRQHICLHVCSACIQRKKHTCAHTPQPRGVYTYTQGPIAPTVLCRQLSFKCTALFPAVSLMSAS